MNVAAIIPPPGSSIAMASSRDRSGARAERWTELEVFFIPDPSGRCFLAEVRGCSALPGERTTCRRSYVGTLTKALDRFGEGRLGERVRSLAMDWMEAHPNIIRDRLRECREDEARAAVQRSSGFDGTGGMAGALRWLYPAVTNLAGGQLSMTRSERIAEFVKDFGVPESTVRAAVRDSLDAKRPTSWVAAFIGALMFFDREAFLANKGWTIVPDAAGGEARA